MGGGREGGYKNGSKGRGLSPQAILAAEGGAEADYGVYLVEEGHEARAGHEQPGRLGHALRQREQVL